MSPLKDMHDCRVKTKATPWVRNYALRDSTVRCTTRESLPSQREPLSSQIPANHPHHCTNRYISTYCTLSVTICCTFFIIFLFFAFFSLICNYAYIDTYIILCSFQYFHHIWIFNELILKNMIFETHNKWFLIYPKCFSCNISCLLYLNKGICGFQWGSTLATESLMGVWAPM